MAQPPTTAEPVSLRDRAGELLDDPAVALWATVAAVAAAVGVLLVRLVPDVNGKPLFDDEVVAGLTSVRPIGQLLDIVLFDRGGAPLHFLVAHFALAVSPSPETLRWLSVFFAVATVLVCYDLGHRLAGRTAGVVAAIVAGTSSMLAVYGTVGRMYALFALASAVAVDLFVRALDERTPGAVYVAAVAAWVLPAVHPYGLVIAGIELCVALVLWRGRPFKPAIPVLVLVLALAPFVVADLRLGERFGVGTSASGSVASPDFAADQLRDALSAFAGGAGLLALAFCALAIAGLYVVFRSRPAFAVFALLALAAVPILMVLARADDQLVSRLSPRHLMFGLPIWAALVGVGVARIVRDLPRIAVPAAICIVGLAAVFAPAGLSDPRTDPDQTEAALAAPADWVRERVEPDSVLLFYSPVFLEALDETRHAIAIPRSGKPLKMVQRADYPVPELMVALPLKGTAIDAVELEASLPSGEVGVFPGWLVVSVPGPYEDENAVLFAGADTLQAILDASSDRSLQFRFAVRSGLVTVCDALGADCPPDLLG
jgi:Dolichyl-phosphate-mannose-protein mannosyltransferase